MAFPGHPVSMLKTNHLPEAGIYRDTKGSDMPMGKVRAWEVKVWQEETTLYRR